MSGILWAEFGKVAIAHLFAMMSPGPDFAMVLKQSLAHGRRTAIWTSLGIGTACFVHVAYSLLGIGLLVAGSQMWFDAVKYAGAAYLAWIGVQSLRAKPRAVTTGNGTAAGIPGDHSAFATGFLTNALNPKASLFFIALFSVVIDPQRTPKLIQAGYGVWMSVLTMVWFTIVSMVFTRDNVRRAFLSHGHWIDRALGVVFLALALSLALASMR